MNMPLQNLNPNNDMMKDIYQNERVETMEVREKSKPYYSNNSDNQLKVQVYNTEDSFQALAGLWNDLSEKVNGHIYTSNDWTECWWRYFGKNEQRSPFIITVWHLDEIIALAPMYIGYSKIGPYIIERRLQIMGSGGSPNEQFGFTDDYGISDFLDFLVDETYAEEVAKIILEFIRSNQYKIDTVTFYQVGDDSFIMKYLYPLIEQKNLDYDLNHTDTCPFIDLKEQSSLSKYVKQVKSNARRRFRQTLKAVGKEKGFEIEDVDSSIEIASAVERLIGLHQNRWNQLGFPGVFYDKRYTGFFKEIVRSSYSKNCLWFKQARDKSGVCALRMVLNYNGRYYDYISGFDPDCPSSKYRPGISLLLNLVEEAIENNTERIELLRGEEGYKYDFTSENFKNWRLTFYPRNRKNSLASILKLPLRVTALGYKYTTREWGLMQVQYQQKGILKMFTGYMSFRINSLKMKLES